MEAHGRGRGERRGGGEGGELIVGLSGERERRRDEARKGLMGRRGSSGRDSSFSSEWGVLMVGEEDAASDFAKAEKGEGALGGAHQGRKGCLTFESPLLRENKGKI